MTLRMKLFLCFFAFTLLIVGVGLVFYVQLKSLIEPLTPQSIPRSVEQLENSIDNRNIIYRLLYQELITENNLDRYIYTTQLTPLQDYYMNVSLLSDHLADAASASIIDKETINAFYHLKLLQQKMIDLVKSNHADEARSILISPNYTNNLNLILNKLNKDYLKVDNASNESAIITVKQATKSTTHVLEQSLSVTILIFIEAILIAIFLSYMAAKTISLPIRRFKHQVDNIIQSGVFTPVDTSITSLNEEIADLAKSFNILLENLRNTTVTRDELAREVAMRKLYEADLNATTERLKESNKALDAFAYAASHDLRAPLQAIENLANWLIEDCRDILPERSQNHLLLLKQRVMRLDNLIAGILTYSRIGRAQKNLEEVDFNIIIGEVIDALEPPNHIQIIIDRYMPSLLADRTEVVQVFMNLLSNAIKYNDKSQGVIHIGYQDISGFYQFYVSDNGVGIDPIYHETIFKIFQTLQSRDTIESSGIGLAIVKKIIEKEGGSIWVKSKLHEETTIYFTWPKL